MSLKSFCLGVIATLFFLLLASCSSPPRVYSNEDPEAVFSSFTTFAFQEKLGTDRAEYTSLLSQFLKTAVTREMNSRGYKQVEDNPNLLINFYVETKEKIKSTSTPAYGGYYGYRPYGTWGGYAGYETQITQYTEGTLTIDIVEVGRDQLIWEGTLVDRIYGDQAENLRLRVEQAVQSLYIKFPYRAGE
ncbi:MAG: DUF4136 domain-containing protein [Pseudomonadota bacterium]|nr:DUF4136 domain-containing protein [Pseudomonadota bacterium]